MAVQTKTYIFCSNQITTSLHPGLRVSVGAHMNVRHQHTLGAHKAQQVLELHQSSVPSVGFCLMLTLFITSGAEAPGLGSP